MFYPPDKPYIVYGEDDADDLQLLHETLKEINPSLFVLGCADGTKVYEFLESIIEGKSLPGLIILDLNTPKWSGFQTLQVLKCNDYYKDIPVIIFTNSDHPDHRQRCLELGAKDFIVKPYRMEELLRICMEFASYFNGPAQIKSSSTSVVIFHRIV